MTATVSTVPLHEVHQSLGANMVPFAGWSMPVRYQSDLAEHHAVREAAGLFDVSHMGRIDVQGPAAETVLRSALVSRVHDLAGGQARYTMLCDESGGVVDDLIVTRLDERFMVVANAANSAAVLEILQGLAQGHDVSIRRQDDHVLLALQGPRSAAVLSGALDPDADAASEVVHALRPFRTTAVRLAGTSVLISRTGYTGEDGFEIFCDDPASGRAVWDTLLHVGADHGTLPCGLAARDTLRLEAGFPLHGHELGPTLGPYETGFARIVHFDDGYDFSGRNALERLARTGPTRTIVGLIAEGRRSPRAGYPVLNAGAPIGAVTSGSPSPTLGVPIALAAVEAGSVQTGDEVTVDVRGTAVTARVTDLPFVLPAAKRAPNRTDA